MKYRIEKKAAPNKNQIENDFEMILENKQHIYCMFVCV